MIIDAHAHFEPRLMNEDEVLRQMDENKIDKMALTPYMTNPPESVKPGSLMAVQRMMFYYNSLRPLGIAITKSMYKKEGEWDLGPLKYLMKAPKQKLEIVTRPDNASVRAVIDRHPTRFLQWVMLNLNDPEAPKELEKLARLPHVLGVKLHPFWHRFPLKKISAIAPFLQETHLPVNIHLGFDEAGDYSWLLDNYPDLKIVFAHLGVPYYKALWQKIRDRKNVFMDISSTYHVDRKLIHRAVSMVGSEAILFASDTPYTAPGSLQLLRQWIEELPISDSEKQGILTGNFHRLVAQK